MVSDLRTINNFIASFQADVTSGSTYKKGRTYSESLSLPGIINKIQKQLDSLKRADPKVAQSLEPIQQQLNAKASLALKDQQNAGNNVLEAFDVMARVQKSQTDLLFNEKGLNLTAATMCFNSLRGLEPIASA